MGRISESIGERYKQWFKSKEQFFYIKGGTGNGKTTFILNQLLDYCAETGKNILFFCNRNALVSELKAKIALEYVAKSLHIDVISFQSFPIYMNIRNKLKELYPDISFQEVIKNANYCSAYSDLGPYLEKYRDYLLGRDWKEYNFVVLDEVHYTI